MLSILLMHQGMPAQNPAVVTRLIAPAWGHSLKMACGLGHLGGVRTKFRVPDSRGHKSTAPDRIERVGDPGGST
jgi:hypothetical protein